MFSTQQFPLHCYIFYIDMFLLEERKVIMKKSFNFMLNALQLEKQI